MRLVIKKQRCLALEIPSLAHHEINFRMGSLGIIKSVMENMDVLK